MFAASESFLWVRINRGIPYVAQLAVTYLGIRLRHLVQRVSIRCAGFRQPDAFFNAL